MGISNPQQNSNPRGGRLLARYCDWGNLALVNQKSLRLFTRFSNAVSELRQSPGAFRRSRPGSGS